MMYDSDSLKNEIFHWNRYRDHEYLYGHSCLVSATNLKIFDCKIMCFISNWNFTVSAILFPLFVPEWYWLPGVAKGTLQKIIAFLFLLKNDIG